MDVSRPYLVLPQVVNVIVPFGFYSKLWVFVVLIGSYVKLWTLVAPYGFKNRFRAYDSSNVKEVSAGGLGTTATAQLRQFQNRKISVTVVYTIFVRLL